eukprot:XP_001710273.1 VSP [Giardia lamblia ATCC 50803]
MLLGIVLLCAAVLAKECVPQISGCAECDESTGTKCTRCDPAGNTPFLMETTPDGGEGTCVGDCTQTPGYYGDASDDQNKKCKKCNAACAACSGAEATKCTRCDPAGNTPFLMETTPDGGEGTCVGDCTQTPGYYGDASDDQNKKCKKCNAACAACSGAEATKCTRCDPAGNTPFLMETTPDGGEGTCVGDCTQTPGYYGDASDDQNKKCKKCNAACAACSGAEATKCTRCDPAGNTPFLMETTPDGGEGTCVGDCTQTPGYYGDASDDQNKKCKKCNAACAACSGAEATKCTRCDPAGNTPFLMETTPDGGEGTCVGDCTQTPGYYGDASDDQNKKCKKCNAACAACSGAEATKCTRCDPAGNTPFLMETTPDGGEGTCVGDCTQTPGYYGDASDDQNKKCKKCNAACAACSGAEATKCTRCDPAGNTPFLMETTPDGGEGTCVGDCTQTPGYYGDASDDQNKKCKKCNAACAACSGAEATKCTRCDPAGNTPFLMETTPDGGEGTCVGDCTQTPGYYGDASDDQNKKCKKCNAACAACSGAEATKCTRCDPAGNTPFLMETTPDGGEGTCVGDCTQTPGYYGDASDDQNKKCKKCAEGQKPNTAGNKCFVCPDANCERCDQSDVCARCSTGAPLENGKCPAATPGCHSSCDGCTSDAMTNQADKCTGCKEGRYLKPNPAAGQSGTCLTAEECTSDKTHFTKEKVGDSKGMCLPCSDATHGIADCKKCALKTLSGETESTVVCSECTDKWLTPSGNACLEQCPAGTYPNDNNLCTPCHDTCAECNGNADAASCTACYPGYSLLYGSGTAGTCVKECTGAFGANCADGQCTADVGGAKYCAQCKDGYAPIDGICTAVKTGRDASVCTAAGGKCTKCAGEYTLMSGGCYGVAKLPGKSVCTLANNGKCTMCAANSQAPVQDKCPECSEGCAKCNDSNACTECLPGYYKNKSSACIPCSKDSTPITGVPNCVSCAPPAGGNGGPVLCYLMKGADNTGGSTNKSGLSTGAIAGISVAVIVVVGGLVGFLCWWFLCRGKA